MQLQTCQYWDGEAAGWCLVWICQLAWTAYGVFIAYTTRNTGMRALVGDYGKAGVFGVGLGLLGYFCMIIHIIISCAYTPLICAL